MSALGSEPIRVMIQAEGPAIEHILLALQNHFYQVISFSFAKRLNYFHQSPLGTNSNGERCTCDILPVLYCLLTTLLALSTATRVFYNLAASCSVVATSMSNAIGHCNALRLWTGILPVVSDYPRQR
eukprot:scaffold19_cov114-Cylindrotheca_fusiformis.AAC.2